MSSRGQDAQSRILLNYEQRRKRMIIFIVIISFLAGTAAVIGVYKPMVKERGLPVLKRFSMLDYFPVSEGYSWSYRHRSGLPDAPNSALAAEKDYQIRVEKLYQKQYYALAVMRGDPINISPHLKTGYLITSNRVYFLDNKLIERFETAIMEREPLPTELLPDSPLFEFPLYEGLRWGPADKLLKGNKGVYLVKQEKFLQLTRGKKEPIYRAYLITYFDDVKDLSILYSPGLGIVSVTSIINNHMDKSVLYDFRMVNK